MLKEKLHYFDNLPLLSARDIKEYFPFKIYKEMSEAQMIDRMYERQVKPQQDINCSYSKQRIC